MVHLLKEGDQAAFAEIYQRYAESLTGFAAYKLYSLEDARDIVHDLFIKVWQDRMRLQINGELKAWLFTVVRYRIIDCLRRNMTRTAYQNSIQSLEKHAPPVASQKVEVIELQQQVDQLLNKLSPRVKEIYHLSREEQLSIPEIAQRLRLSEQTVKNQLTTALGHLRKSLPDVLISLLAFWWLH